MSLQLYVQRTRYLFATANYLLNFGT